MKRLISLGMSGLVLFLVCFAIVKVGESAEPRKTENVIFVMTDGLRPQEVFTGAEEPLLNETNPDGKKKLSDAARSQFWRDTPEARRKILLPFFWNVMAKEGQVYGNAAKQSPAQLTNGLKFSYPGYSETLCGFVDPKIDSNTPGPNPNVTVLEWLNAKEAFHGRVAAFGAWCQFNDIINRRRCGFLVNAGYDALLEDIGSPQVALLNELKKELPKTWGGEPFDAVTFHTALEYFKAKKPRVFYLALGETDEWGHGGKYDEYLISARRADDYVKTLWETAQAMPEYRGKTTLIFLTDHGRGNGPEWRGHGKDIVDAENIWMGFLGTDTPALGERENVPMVTQNQIAATLAALLGEDYNADVAKAGKPIADVLGR